MNAKTAVYGTLFSGSVLANVIFGSMTFIKPLEGEVRATHKDPAGYTGACIGNRSAAIPGATFTEEECLLLLLSDVIPHVIAVSKLSKRELDAWAWIALTSFSFNHGWDALRNSTLLAKWNAGDRKGAEAEFEKWRKGGGKVLPGLVVRRGCEAALFMGNPLPANCPHHG